MNDENSDAVATKCGFGKADRERAITNYQGFFYSPPPSPRSISIIIAKIIGEARAARYKTRSRRNICSFLFSLTACTCVFYLIEMR